MWTALAEPHRRAVLGALIEGEQTVNQLVAALHLSQPSTSKHLKVLRAAGLVRVRAQGSQRWYRLDPEPLTELDQWLAPYRRKWNAALDRLGDHLSGQREGG